MDAVKKCYASCVSFLGFLNRGAGVYLIGMGIGRTGYVSSSEISGSSNTDSSFCTFGITVVVLLCLLVSKIYLSLITLSTDALIVGFCICLILLVRILRFIDLLASGVSYHWGLASPSEWGEIPPLELSGISPSNAWRFDSIGVGIVRGA